MRRIFQMYIVFFIMALFCNSACAEIRNIQDNYELIYTILDSNGTSVTGQTPSLKIQKASNGQWLDFDDMTFKGSTWGNKTITLTEDAVENLYYYIFNPPASETGAEQYAFLIDNTNTTYKDHQIELVNYQNIGTSTLNDKTGYSLANAEYQNISNYTWANTTRILTAGTNIALAKGVGITGFNDITAQNVWEYTTRSLTDKTNFFLNASEYINTTNAVWNNGTRTLSAFGFGVTVTTNNDKAGYSLTGNQTINITGNLSGSVGSVVGNVGGSVASVVAGVTVTTNNDKTSYRLSATGIDDIWDELQTGHATPGSFGLYLDSKVSEAGGGITVEDIVAAVWDETLASHITAGSTGKKLSESPTPYDIGP